MKAFSLLFYSRFALSGLLCMAVLKAAEESSNQISVTVTLTQKAKRSQEITLPGALMAIKDTAIRARTNGYIGSYAVDIGDHVTEGQLLATIESPEVDQDLNQALANYDQAKANLELAQIAAKRWKNLGEKNAVSQQEVDQKEADYLSRKADLNVAKAHVKKYEDLKKYEQVVAPFSGSISVRNIDIGSLINAGTGPELFHITQSDMLRAYVNLPQSAVRSIKIGQTVEVLISEYPHTLFPAHITRISSALDAPSRTLLTEVLVPNHEGKLLPGMYCQVRLTLTQPEPAIVIPSNNTIIRADGTWVATLNAENKIHITKVLLGRDFGTEIEVLDGLIEGVRTINNPSDTLQEGQLVEIHNSQTK